MKFDFIYIYSYNFFINTKNYWKRDYVHMEINIQIIASDNLCNLLSKKLLDQNYNVVSTCSSYEDCFSSYATSLPDIVLIDLDISNSREGLLACRKICNSDRSAKVIAFTENLDIATKSELFEIGVEYWHEKPIEMSRLFECIDAISRKYNLLELRGKRGTINYDESIYSTEIESSINTISEDIKYLRNQIQQRKCSNEDYIYSEQNTSFDLDFELDTKDDYLEYSYNSKSNSYTSCNYPSQQKEQCTVKRGYLNLPVFINDSQECNKIPEASNKYTANTNLKEETSKKRNNNPLSGLFSKFKK